MSSGGRRSVRQWLRDAFSRTRYEVQGTTLVARKGSTVRRVDLATAKIEYSASIKGYRSLLLTGTNGHFIDLPVDDETEALRRQLGGQLREHSPGRVWGERRVRDALGLQ